MRRCWRFDGLVEQSRSRTARLIGRDRAEHMILAFLPLVITVSAAQPPAAPDRPAAVIQSYKNDVADVCSANTDVHLSIGRDPLLQDQPVLFVEYPAASADPAARDVRCDVEEQNWTAGRAISFQIKPANSVKLSVSFRDGNGVAYTAWTDLQGGVWQLVRILLAEIRPNPYFQPPNATTGAPLDVSQVEWIAFAPQDRAAGRLAIGRFVVSK